MDWILQDLRFASRMLLKNPGFTLVAVLTLALGIGANTAIFSVVQRVLLQPLPYDHPGNLVQVWNTYLPAFPQFELSPGDFFDFSRQSRSFSETAAYVSLPQGFNLTGQGDPERLEARYATSGLFPLLGIRPVLGRGFTLEEDKPGAAPVVLLTHRFWQRRFGADSAVLGLTLLLDGRGHTVAGVLPAESQLAPTADLWMPVGQYADDLTSHVHHEFDMLARLKSGVSVAQAQAEMFTLHRQEELAFPDTHKNWGVVVRPMQDASAAKMRVALLVLFAVVGLVLLIACANIVNLLLARNAARQKELALRVALGASRSRLVGQLLTETLLLAFLGGAVGLLLAVTGLRFLKAFIPPELSRLEGIGLNGWVLAFTLAACFLVGIACGLLPALQTLHLRLHDTLKEGGRSSSTGLGQRIRTALVVSEIALALVPLVGAGLLVRSFNRLLDVDPGFRTERVLSMEVNQSDLPFADANELSLEQQTEIARRQSFQFEEMAERIRALPGVQAVGGINVLPLGTSMRSASRFLIEGVPVQPDQPRPVAEVRTVSLGYFAAMRIPLRLGRLFDTHDYAGQNIVINEALAARYWPGADPIGKRINLCSLAPTPCWSPIVGVVGDVHQYGLEAAPTLDVYFAGGWTRSLLIRTASDPRALSGAAIKAVHESDPNLPVTHVMTLDGLLSNSFSPRRFSMTLLGAFALLALLLAAVGIYGVMSYVVSLRTNEIGIRMALGAQPRDIWALIVGRAARLACAGVALGAAGAFVLTKFIATLLFGVKPADPATFAGVALLLIVVSLLACYLPARRAMRVDPLTALRHE